MTASKIQWCTRSDWNPLRGCTRVSPGCGGPGPYGGCYAEAIAARFSDAGLAFHGFAERTAKGPRWTGKVELIEERLEAPLSWRKPERIFALSMSDLFHEKVPDAWIDRILSVVARCPRHAVLVLTKRAERLPRYMGDPATRGRIAALLGGGELPWPLPNLWLGVSAEDQRRADERIPDLLKTPAAVRFLSCEPLLGPVDLTRLGAGYLRRDALTGLLGAPGGVLAGRDALPGIDWVILGGESGPRAREHRLSWSQSILDQCRASGVAAFEKQLGSNAWDDRTDAKSPRRFKTLDRKGGDMSEWPSELQVREFPVPPGSPGLAAGAIAA